MNLLRDLPPPADGEAVERLTGSDVVRIERIVSRGDVSPPGFWYDQDEAEFVAVLSGAARLVFADGETLAMQPGDWTDIAAHRRHRVEWTAPDRPTVWLAVFYRQEPRMPKQLPGAGEIFLDHTAFFVPAMDMAAASLEQCGFRLTEFTIQTNREGDKTVPSGTGNRCAMLRNGYLEILAATSDTPLSAQLKERIADHPGLHLAAFTSADTAAEHARLAAAGFPTLPLVDMRRPVGDDVARFTIARVAHGTMPEGRAQFLTHHTEKLVWLPDRLDHPNGAEALTALWIAAADPAEPAARYARFTGRPARQEGATTTIALDRGALHFATPGHLKDAFGIVPAGRLPCLAAAAVKVASLARLEACLGGAGLVGRRFAGGIAVSLPSGLGDALIFHA